MMLSFHEIKRRKMFQVAAVYGLTAWLVVQIIVSIETPLQLPDWSDTLVIVLLGLGFPVLLIISWLFNVTPHGLVRDEGPNPVYRHAPVHIEWVLLVLMLTAVAWFAYGTGAAWPEQSDEAEQISEASSTMTYANSIAVLPFENLSANPEDAYFAAGLHEEILTRLAKLKNVRVISRTSVLRYADTELTIPQIAAELKVGAILEGSVRYSEGSVRINTQLIDGETDEHIWSEAYEEKFEHIFAIETTIALSIANALRMEFSRSEADILSAFPTASVDAYRAYLGAPPSDGEPGVQTVPPGMGPPVSSEAEFPGGQPPAERERIRARLNSLQRAIAADPDFAVAYVERAGIYIQALRTPGLAVFLFGSDADPEASAIADIQRALGLSPDLGRAHAWLAMIHRYHWRAGDAQLAFETAVRLSPNDPLVLTNYAHFLSNMGEHDAAIARIEQALQFDPGNPATLAATAQVFAAAGRYDSAVKSLRAITPGQAPWTLPLMANYERVLGHNTLAESALRSAERFALGTDVPQWPALLAYNYARLGLMEDAARFVSRVEDLSEQQPLPAAAGVMISLAQGDEQAALLRLNSAASTKTPFEAFNLLMSIAGNVYQDPILDTPSFRAARQQLLLDPQ